MINSKEFKKNDWDHLHDCIYQVTGAKSSQRELENMFELMPEELQIEALYWGMSDTGWRDDFIDWCESRLENF